MASRSGRSRPGSSRPGAKRSPTRRPASAASVRPPSGPRGGSGEKAPQFTVRAIVLLAIVLLVVASYASSLHTWWGLRQEIQSTRAEIQMRNDAISDLKVRKERWDDPAYVTQQARERFGWVLPGEVGYRVIRSDGSVRGASLGNRSDAQGDGWGQRLWQSLEAAGEDPAGVDAQDDRTGEVVGQ